MKLKKVENNIPNRGGHYMSLINILDEFQNSYFKTVEITNLHQTNILAVAANLQRRIKKDGRPIRCLYRSGKIYLTKEF